VRITLSVRRGGWPLFHVTGGARRLAALDWTAEAAVPTLIGGLPVSDLAGFSAFSGKLFGELESVPGVFVRLLAKFVSG
jgi:hypothetical protein